MLDNVFNSIIAREYYLSRSDYHVILIHRIMSQATVTGINNATFDYFISNYTF